MLDNLVQTRVLLIDDDELVARAFGRLLQLRGHEVTMSASAEHAVELMVNGRFDVVVSDIMMPGAGGLAMLRAVREYDQDLPVILMTGCPSMESAVQAVDSGALKYLTKPLMEGSLEQAVEDAAARSRLARRRRDALANSEQSELKKKALASTFTSAVAQVWMAYQPIISWSRQELYAFEALLRTTENGFPNPGAFLDAAATLDRLDVLGQTVRASVAATLAATPGETLSFVNLHAKDLLDETLYSPVAPLTDFASRVVLEITERASFEHFTDLSGRIARLRKLGFRIAIDDLGAGHSGLNAIAQVEPDIVKIDMALVRGIELERTKRKLVGSLITLCGELGIQVVAEGIETVAERDTLVELGCDLMQGYLFGRPQKGLPAGICRGPIASLQSRTAPAGV